MQRKCRCAQTSKTLGRNEGSRGRAKEKGPGEEGPRRKWKGQKKRGKKAMAINVRGGGSTRQEHQHPSWGKKLADLDLVRKKVVL